MEIYPDRGPNNHKPRFRFRHLIFSRNCCFPTICSWNDDDECHASETNVGRGDDDGWRYSGEIRRGMSSPLWMLVQERWDSKCYHVDTQDRSEEKGRSIYVYIYFVEGRTHLQNGSYSREHPCRRIPNWVPYPTNSHKRTSISSTEFVFCLSCKKQGFTAEVGTSLFYIP